MTPLDRTYNKIVNLTPHEVAVMVGDSIIRIPTSGKIVRVKMACELAGKMNGLPFSICKDSEVVDMPKKKDGVAYIVSSVVGKALKREDVYCPDTSEDGVIRDGNGYILAVKRLQQFL